MLGLSRSKSENCFGSTGKFRALQSMSGNVFRNTISVLSCGNNALNMAHLKHVVVKVFHVDNGMFIGDSSRRRYVRRTSLTGERVKGDHDGSEFNHTRHYVTTTAAGELIDGIVQFGNYRGKIHQLRLVRCTDVYGSRMEIASYATRRLQRPSPLPRLVTSSSSVGRTKSASARKCTRIDLYTST